MLSNGIRRIDAQQHAATAGDIGRPRLGISTGPRLGQRRTVAALMAGLGRSSSSIAAISAIVGVLALLGIVPAAVQSVLHYLGRDLPVQVILAIDVSTSMACPVDHDTLHGHCPGAGGKIPPFKGSSRADAAVTEGVIPAVSYFRKGDAIGVWRFASVLSPGTISEYKGDAELEQRLRPLVGQTSGGTRLNQTIYEGVRRLRRDWKPRTINALVILTDAGDRGSTLKGQPLTEDRLDEVLGAEDPDKPVYVFITAGYDSPGCDKLLTGVEAFHHECFPVNEATSVQDAYNGIQKRLDQLAHRSTGPQ